MQKYILSEQDIRVLIGVAGDAVCESRDVSLIEGVKIMSFAAEITMRILDHLSGGKKFPEEAIQFARMLDRQKNAPVTEAATSERTEKQPITL